MLRGPGRSYDRSAYATGGGYERWSLQTRGDPSEELAARFGGALRAFCPNETLGTFVKWNHGIKRLFSNRNQSESSAAVESRSLSRSCPLVL